MVWSFSSEKYSDLTPLTQARSCFGWFPSSIATSKTCSPVLLSSTASPPSTTSHRQTPQNPVPQDWRISTPCIAASSPKDFWSSASKDQISFPVGSWTFTITVIALNEIKCFECSNMLIIIKRKEIWFWLVSFFDFLRLGSDFSLRGIRSYGLFYDFGRSKRYDRSL